MADEVFEAKRIRHDAKIIVRWVRTKIRYQKCDFYSNFKWFSINEGTSKTPYWYELP